MPKDATLYSRARSPYWWIVYWSPKKRERVWKATPFRKDDPTGRKKAHLLAVDKSQEAAAFKGPGKAEFYATWAEDFLRLKYNGPNHAKTLKRYIGAWGWISTYFDEIDLHHPMALTYNHVIGFVAWRSSQARHCGKLVTKNTALCDVKIISIVQREAVRRGYAQGNPCMQLGIEKAPAKEKAEMTDADIALIRQLLAEREGSLPVTEQWMTTGFEIAIHHGCRETETSMPMSHIDFISGTIRFTAKGRNGQPKIYTNKVHPNLLPRLQALKAAGATMTCVLPAMVAKEWHFFFKSRKELSHLCFHCTRVSVITRLARAGVPIQQAMRYVGHASQTVHKIYQKLKAEDLSACSAALTFL